MADRIRTTLLALVFCLTLIEGARADPHQAIRLSVIDGQARVETAGQGTETQTPFPLASVGKMMTAVAVLRFVARGQLDLDRPASDYVDAETRAVVPRLGDITLRDLLTMRSGLIDYYDDAFLDDPAETAREALDLIAGADLMFRPGTRFDYSNTNYLLLGLILEEVAGKPYAQVLVEDVLNPAGMRDSFVFGTRALPDRFPNGHEDGVHIRDYYTGTAFGDGAVIASAGDVVRFLRTLTATDVLLDARWRAVMLTPVGRSGYGMGVEVDGSIIGHSGADFGFVADARLDLTTGDIAVMLAARDSADTDWTWEVLD